MAGEGRYTSKATATNSGTGIASVPADPRRVLIAFVAPSGLSNWSFGATADNGVTWTFSPATSEIAEFWFARHGTLPSSTWTLTVAGGTTGFILELIDLQIQPEE